MRVLHLDASLDARGGQTQLLLLTSRWGARCPQLVVVRADAPVRSALEAAGVPVATLPARGSLRALAGWTRSLRQIASDFGATLIAAHDRQATVYARRLGLPWVVHRRVDFAPSAWGYARYREANGVIAVSEAVARVMRRGAVERVVVVHDGVEPGTGEASPDRAGVRRELGLPPETALVLAAGALVEHKAHRVLIEAMALLPAVHLVIAGVGPLEGPLRALASEGRVSRRVHLVGWRADLPRWLASVDVFAHPSQEEGLGQVVIEAAFAGLPIVSCQAGGLADLGLGLPFAPGDAPGLARALGRALTGSAMRASMLAQREALSVRFGAVRLVEETFAAYQRFGC